ncbi:hypothetical protein QAA01_06660 [Glaesserella parasuis]|uniref:hypothetical protein n=1 Tax=Glaesserella parasuis TaxID=738 RepID=UPI001923DDDC|nr:hypothetical protein [Glaesserella parasuis]MDG6335615.1 hypothetical protein [Glaesserella parasuis]MDG6429638.1 hypothetical protein [Glaesserella parasuis]MDG6446343.1 hypothetical protein [Glaesserella parasuis]MDG6776758.1 hypothetical protein [Glaesserella parasuis]MDG6819373.1 hypothetical protein [Glaesserella parasuis]
MAVLNTGGQKNLAMISQNSQNGKRDLSSIHVRQLTKSEIQSLRESKREAYERMMKLN